MFHFIFLILIISNNVRCLFIHIDPHLPSFLYPQSSLYSFIVFISFRSKSPQSMLSYDIPGHSYQYLIMLSDHFSKQFHTQSEDQCRQLVLSSGPFMCMKASWRSTTVNHWIDCVLYFNFNHETYWVVEKLLLLWNCIITLHFIHYRECILHEWFPLLGCNFIVRMTMVWSDTVIVPILHFK